VFVRPSAVSAPHERPVRLSSELCWTLALNGPERLLLVRCWRVRLQRVCKRTLAFNPPVTPIPAPVRGGP
jgi:hypothetical protein